MNNNIIPIDNYLEFVDDTNNAGMSNLVQDMIEAGIDPDTPFILAVIQYCANVYDVIVHKFAQDGEVSDEDKAKIMALRNAMHEALKPLNEVDVSVFDICKNSGLAGGCNYINDLDE